MPTLTTYDFDPTGLLVANRITGEVKAATTSTYRDYSFIVPDAAPFFRNGLVLRRYPTNELLVEGVDYFLTHKFYDATTSTALDVYGSISFFNTNIVGNVTMTYHTIGGSWVLSTNVQMQKLYNSLLNPRVAFWDQIIDLPFQFPVINHGLDLNDLRTSADITSGLNDIAAAIQEHNSQANTFATLNEALAGVLNNRQMSPATTAAVLQSALANTGDQIESTFLFNSGALSNVSWDLFGDHMFVDTPTQSSFKLTYSSSAYRLAPGSAYIKGYRVVKGSETVLTTPTLAADLWMIVLLPDSLAHMSATVDFTWMAKNATLSYDGGGRSYYSFKVATVDTGIVITDHRILHQRGYGLAFGYRNPATRVTEQSTLLQIDRDYLLDGSLTGGQVLSVILPDTTSLAFGQYIDLDRTLQSDIALNVFNPASDRIRVEKPDGNYVEDTAAEYNINTSLRVIWQGSFWGI